MKTLLLTLVATVMVSTLVSTASADSKPRLIGFSIKNGEARIMIDRGSKNGITKGKSGVLVDAEGKRSSCIFKVQRVRVSKSSASLKCTWETMKSHKFVEWL